MTAPVRLSPEASRALDRLARRAHAFHRFAHHPLCGRYASELVTLGPQRTRVCRGCLAAALGALTGAAVCLVSRPQAAVLYAVLAAGVALGAVSLRLRLPKTLGRFVPAAAAGFAIASVLTGPTSFAWLSGALTFAAAVAAYRRRQPNRTPCATCPERTGANVCSGYARIVRRERAFQHLAGRIIATDLAARRTETLGALSRAPAALRRAQVPGGS